MAKYKKVLQALVVILFLLMFVFAGISIFNRVSKTEFAYRAKEPLKIGATYMTLNNPFFKIVDDEIRSAVEAKGDVLISLDPALDLERQKEQIQYLIDQKVKAIIVNPVDFYGLTPALEAAKKAGIPIITVDTEVMDADLVSYSVMSDNYNAGVQCAKDVMKRKESAEILLIQHSTAYSAVQRIQGFVDTIKNNPNYRVVGRVECEGQLEQAMPEVQKFLNKNIDFDVIMALNDPSALGTLAAMQANNQLDGILVYGVDGSPEAKGLVKDGIMTATVAQSPKTLGKLAIENTYNILEDKAYETQQRIPVSIITKKNIANYSLEGWQ